jgi:hypothetical protein
VTLPMVTGPITGPGAPYESVQSLAPGKGLAEFKYEAKEYFITGTANGQPYKTRIVIRKPASNSKFSGWFCRTHASERFGAHVRNDSIYTMTSGHAAVDISAGGLQQVIDANPERYKGFQVGNAQISEIIAQVGALVKSKDPSSPFAGLTVRKMVLGGTSAPPQPSFNTCPRTWSTGHRICSGSLTASFPPQMVRSFARSMCR